MLCNLRKIHLVGSDHFFSGIDLHVCEIRNYAKRGLFFYDPLYLGTADEVIMADLLKCDM